jgi:7,8-dihydropterin-6-yl-methyl-4-(beta-D-ribofuranosyl)aminobenzene 5'-phosphate synthase
MSAHAVFRTGQVGRHVIAQLLGAGRRVTAISRSGRQQVAGAINVAGDATNPEFTTAACAGADVVYFCLDAPDYGRWPEQFPPLQRGVLAGAAAARARLVVLENLYGYGPVRGQVLHEDLPLGATTAKGRTRAAMTEALLDAHVAGTVEVAIGRASDYFGPGATHSALGELVFAAALEGKTAQIMGDPDRSHSYSYSCSYTPDVAAGLIVLGTEAAAAGSVWHLPIAETWTTRRIIEHVCSLNGTKPRSFAAGRTSLRMYGSSSRRCASTSTPSTSSPTTGSSPTQVPWGLRQSQHPTRRRPGRNRRLEPETRHTLDAPTGARQDAHVTPQASPTPELDELTVTIVVDNATDTLSSIAPGVPQLPEMAYILGSVAPTGHHDGHDCVVSLDHLCVACHGFSALATARRKDRTASVLFDVGPYGDVWVANADRMNVDLKTIEVLFLSHWHWDHTGGITAVVAAIAGARAAAGQSPLIVDVPPDRPDQRGILTPLDVFAMLPLEPTIEASEAAGGRVTAHSEAHLVADLFLASGDIPRQTSYETGLPGHHTWRSDNVTADPEIRDERFLTASVRGRGTTVFSACSHAGIINVGLEARRLSADQPIDLLLGGYHLAGAAVEDRIASTVRDNNDAHRECDPLGPGEVLHLTGA